MNYSKGNKELKFIFFNQTYFYKQTECVKMNKKVTFGSSSINYTSCMRTHLCPMP